MESIELIGIPIDSVGGPIGTTAMPRVLRESGIVEALRARDLGDLDVLIEASPRDPTTGIIGSDSVSQVTRVIRDAIETHADPQVKLLVLGGCCTLAVGVIAGLRRRFGRIGVVYLDGHLDLYDGETSPTGEAADMPLAVALGVGPKAWAAAAGDSPLLLPDDVALLGFRDLDEARSFGSVTPADLPGLLARDADSIVREGLTAAALESAEVVSRGDRSFFVFVDLDILDESVFPNDAPVPDGLDWSQLRELLLPLLSHPSNLGIAVACYNPERDPDRVGARRIIELLQATLGR